MFGIENYPAFIAAAILLNITPGTDTVYIISRSIAQGTKAGIVSALGICTGAIGHTLLAALGLSILLTTSTTLFFLVKLTGAIYLIYLGIKIFREEGNNCKNDILKHSEDTLKKIYFQGIITNLLNPKVALFFIAFLPQFININSTFGSLPFLMLGATFVTTGTLWCCFLASCAGKATSFLRAKQSVQRFLQKTTGVVFILLGAQLALSKTR